MKRLLGLALLILLFVGGAAFAGTGCVSGGTCNTTTTVQATITGGNVCIGSDSDFDFGTTTAVNAMNSITISFAGYFFVEDLKGADSGYYTTVQMSGHLFGTGGALISGLNVHLQSPVAPTLLAGRANPRVIVWSGITTYQSLDLARQLILRSGANNQGIVGRYGVVPTLRVRIPPYQQVGTYSGTLVYTLIEN